MAYNTPELLLVGAAQNLVLTGPIPVKTGDHQLADLDTLTYFNEPDSASW